MEYLMSQRRSSSSSWYNWDQYIPTYDPVTWVGIGLAIFSNALISISLNVQKYAHNQNELLGHNRLPYTKLKIWWVGMVINVIGEIGNLVAYGYAEATTVTPIGAVGVVFSVVIATFVLKEKFRRMHGYGILLICTGVVLIVYSKGTETVIEPTVEEFLEYYVHKTQFYVYTIIVLCLTWGMYVASKKHGGTYVILYTGLCSLIASWTVIGCKAFMSFFRLTVEKGENQFGNCPFCFIPLLTLGIIIFCAAVSLHFLQCAMRYHDNNKVIPTYYATFTLACIIGAAVVYREFEGSEPGTIMLFTFGCGLAAVGVFLIGRASEMEHLAAEGTEMVQMKKKIEHNGNGHKGQERDCDAAVGILGHDELQQTTDAAWNDGTVARAGSDVSGAQKGEANSTLQQGSAQTLLVHKDEIKSQIVDPHSEIIRA